MKIKKGAWRWILLVLVLFLVAGITVVLTTRVHHYKYPIDVMSPDWHDYTVSEKVVILKIPDETLERMTNIALVTAIYEYPYVGDIYLFGVEKEFVCETFNGMLSRFSAAAELKSRNLSPEALKMLAMPYKIKLFIADGKISNPDNFYAWATVDILSILAGEPLGWFSKDILGS